MNTDIRGDIMMKAKFNTLILIILVVSILTFVGCTHKTSNNNTEVEMGTDITSEQEESSEASTQKPQEIAPSIPEVEYDTRTDTGRFAGYQNGKHIKILISGVPESIAEKTFLVDDVVRTKIEKIDLKEDDVVKFEYYIDEDGENVIVEISIL